MKMTMTINGQSQTVEAEEDIPLLWLLRDSLALTGTKYGCGIAQCGACTVLVDGKARRACMTKAQSVIGKNITTIEGPQDQVGQTLVQVWNELNVHQCGYCQSGQIMAAIGLLKNNNKPTDQEIDKAMSGCICRCNTYVRIRQAIHQAAKQLQA